MKTILLFSNIHSIFVFHFEYFLCQKILRGLVGGKLQYDAQQFMEGYLTWMGINKS